MFWKKKKEYIVVDTVYEMYDKAEKIFKENNKPLYHRDFVFSDWVVLFYYISCPDVNPPFENFYYNYECLNIKTLEIKNVKEEYIMLINNISSWDAKCLISKLK
jgi:hypothetical protein